MKPPPTFLIFLTLLLSSCGQKDKESKSNSDQTSVPDTKIIVNCNVAGYIFSLGEDLTETKKKWPLLEKQAEYSEGKNKIEGYAEIYEAHLFYFQFYNDKLISAELNIPQSELKGRDGSTELTASIEVDGKIIRYDTTFSSPTSVTETNCAIDCTPMDFDGMKAVTIKIQYKGLGRSKSKQNQ